MSIKILHTADWHLGRRFASFDAPNERQLMHARLEAVRRAIGTANRSNVDAVLCAGDLFDSPNPDAIWWQGAAELLNDSKAPVVLLPGNHDPIVEGSVYQAGHGFRKLLSSHVLVVEQSDFSFELGSEAVIHAVPCRTKAGERNLVAELPLRGDSDHRIRIAMVHGTTFDLPGHDANFPIYPDQAAERGFDYLALGDTHGFQIVPADLPTVYPGTPEPTNFGEREAGQVALVTFPGDGRAPIIEAVAVSLWSWREAVCHNLGELERLAKSDNRNTVLRLRLDMDVALAEQVTVDALLTSLAGSDASPGSAGILTLDKTGLRLSGTVSADELPDDLSPLIMAAFERLGELASDAREGDAAKRALLHLWTLSRGGEMGRA